MAARLRTRRRDGRRRAALVRARELVQGASAPRAAWRPREWRGRGAGWRGEWRGNELAEHALSSVATGTLRAATAPQRVATGSGARRRSQAVDPRTLPPWASPSGRWGSRTGRRSAWPIGCRRSRPSSRCAGAPPSGAAAVGTLGALGACMRPWRRRVCAPRSSTTTCRARCCWRSTRATGSCAAAGARCRACCRAFCLRRTAIAGADWSVRTGAAVQRHRHPIARARGGAAPRRAADRARRAGRLARSTGRQNERGGCGVRARGRRWPALRQERAYDRSARARFARPPARP